MEDGQRDWRSSPGFLPLFLAVAAVGGVIGSFTSGQWLAGTLSLLAAVALIWLAWHLYRRPWPRRSHSRHRR